MEINKWFAKGSKKEHKKKLVDSICSKKEVQRNGDQQLRKAMLKENSCSHVQESKARKKPSTTC